METTIKLSKETKERLSKLNIAGKGKTFDMIVNELISIYQNYNKKYAKDYKKWEKSMNRHENDKKTYKKRVQDYEKSIKTWKKLLKWAKSKGFKE